LKARSWTASARDGWWRPAASALSLRGSSTRGPPRLGCSIWAERSQALPGAPSTAPASATRSNGFPTSADCAAGSRLRALARAPRSRSPRSAR
jgi:hypothetical protein